MELYTLLENTSDVRPDKIAVVCGSRSFTYLQFKGRVDKLAGSFHSHGIIKGDRIAIIHQNCHIFLESYFAAAKIGAVLVPFNYRLSPKDFAYILNRWKMFRLILMLGDEVEN